MVYRFTLILNVLVFFCAVAKVTRKKDEVNFLKYNFKFLCKKYEERKKKDGKACQVKS